MKSRTGGLIIALVILMALGALLYISEDRLNPGKILNPEASGRMLVPFSDVKSYDVILDVSPNASQYIPGAINLNYELLIDTDKRLRSDSELSQILGNAGISRKNSVVVYGECQPCGGGPSAATYMYWVMKHLGQEKLGLLDGGIKNWSASGLPTTKVPAHRSKTAYIPMPRAGLMATYDLVNDSQTQIVDARTPQDYSYATIPRSINIPYDAVLTNGKFKDRSSLGQLFADLAKDRPVVVFTATGVKASMVCCALDILGYRSSIYSWNDWIAHKRDRANETSRYSEKI